jgi:hypothetical protein
MNSRTTVAIFLMFVLASIATSDAAQWQPAAGPLMTRWAAAVTPDLALPDYPRPQLVRRDWLNLNGLWDYAIRPRGESAPASFDGRILVPFPIESALSGVMKKVGDANRLWYRRTFDVPASWRGRRTLLHFGAIDWDATVYVDGRPVGSHRGGYDAFTIDVSEAAAAGGRHELVVSVWDPADNGTQPRGKQVNNPRGIWYTSVTGIWQTVWLEPVPDMAIDGLTLVPDIDAGVLSVTATAARAGAGVAVRSVALDGAREIASGSGAPGAPFTIALPSAARWSPDSPKLYNLKVTLERRGAGAAAVDEVTSYFGMRKTSLCKDASGTLSLCLNNAPLFQAGPLDQGWWPDGLYTAPTDDALRYDIEVTRRLGFNMARKHVKVEPDRWYYWADRLGLLVWQDMPSTTLRGERTPESAQQFEAELKALIDGRRNHPSIVMWVPFNEGWGQYDTQRITNWIKQYDPSRLVNNASGWTDMKVGDVNDIHRYPGPGVPKTETGRAVVLGEFGGLGLPLPGHTWQSQANWSYRGFTTREALTDAYVELFGRLHPLAGTPGLSAAVYTQTTDVEIEVNGLMTYDRALIKPDEARARAAALNVFTPPPSLVTLVPTARDTATDIAWRYTTTAPAAAWMMPEFDDAAWSSGRGGFGTANTPGAIAGTLWNTPDIWIRRAVDLPAGLTTVNPQLFLHHDEDAEVYINGVLALKIGGYSTDYELAPITPEGRAALRPGRNSIAVHCHQTNGGQYIDVGLVDLLPAASRRNSLTPRNLMKPLNPLNLMNPGNQR